MRYEISCECYAIAAKSKPTLLKLHYEIFKIVDVRMHPNFVGLRTFYQNRYNQLQPVLIRSTFFMNKQNKRLVLVLGAVSLLSAILPQRAFAGHTNTILHTMLDGSAEVAADGDTSLLVGDANGMGEAYVFGIDGDETTLCYSLFVSGIQEVLVKEGMAAHIHEGAMNENGPVVAALAGPEDGNAADCLSEDEEGKFPTGEMGIVQRILENPEDFYVNVHNPQYPAGAVRGQLQSKTDHSH